MQKGAEERRLSGRGESGGLGEIRGESGGGGGRVLHCADKRRTVSSGSTADSSGKGAGRRSSVGVGVGVAVVVGLGKSGNTRW